MMCEYRSILFIMPYNSNLQQSQQQKTEEFACIGVSVSGSSFLYSILFSVFAVALCRMCNIVQHKNTHVKFHASENVALDEVCELVKPTTLSYSFDSRIWMTGSSGCVWYSEPGTQYRV